MQPAELLKPSGEAFDWLPALAALGLSRQQQRVVALILDGKGDKQIAAALGISFHTVRTHLKRIFARLGVGDRVELVLRVLAARDTVAPGVPKNGVTNNSDLKPIREKAQNGQRLNGVGWRGGRAGRLALAAGRRREKEV